MPCIIPLLMQYVVDHARAINNHQGGYQDR